MSKKKKINFYSKYRKEAQRKLEVWQELVMIMQNLDNMSIKLKSYLDNHDTFGEKESIDKTKQ